MGAQVTYPVFIVCRDRLTCLVDLLGWLADVGHDDEVYLIDNESTYPPLLDFYKHTEHTVIDAGGNFGERVGWSQGIIHRYAAGRRFIYTDPDLLPVEDCPRNAIEQMAKVLDRDGSAVKCGFSLKVDDLPAWSRDGIQAWEAPFWLQFDGMVGGYRAPIDTTFSLYSTLGLRRFKYKPAYRLPEPYLMRHLPWYADPEALTDEERYYLDHADTKVSNWARYIKAPGT